MLKRLLGELGLPINERAPMRDVIPRLSKSLRDLVIALMLASRYHGGYVGPVMLRWAMEAAGATEEDVAFVEKTGFLQRSGDNVFLFYPLFDVMFEHISPARKLEILSRLEAVAEVARQWEDTHLVLGMNYLDMGHVRRGLTHLMCWGKHAQRRRGYYLDKVVTVFTSGAIPYDKMTPTQIGCLIWWLWSRRGPTGEIGKLIPRLKGVFHSRVLAVIADYSAYHGVPSPEVVAEANRKNMEGTPAQVYLDYAAGRFAEIARLMPEASRRFSDAVSKASRGSLIRMEALNSLGRVYAELGDVKSAGEVFEELLTEAKAYRMPLYVLKAYNNLAAVLLPQDFRAAVRVLSEAYDVAVGTGTFLAPLAMENYLEVAYEFVPLDTYLMMIKEVMDFLELSGATEGLLAANLRLSTYLPLLMFRMTALLDEWEKFLGAYFASVSSRSEVRARFAWYLALKAARYFMEGDRQSAFTLLAEAEGMVRNMPDDAYAVYVYAIGTILFGFARKPAEFFRFSSKLSTKYGHLLWVRVIADALKPYFLGDIRAAEMGLRRAVRRLHRDGMKFSSAIAAFFAADIAREAGDIPTAVRFFRRCMSILRGLAAYRSTETVGEYLKKYNLWDVVLAIGGEDRWGQMRRESLLADVEAELVVERLSLMYSSLLLSQPDEKAIARTLADIVHGRYMLGAEVEAGGYLVRRGEPKGKVFSFRSGGVKMNVYVPEDTILPDSQERFMEVLTMMAGRGLELIEFKNLAIRDALTGLYTRWYFFERFREEEGRAVRLGRPLSVIMMDIDNFKRINDTYGHAEGDEVLRRVGQVIGRRAAAAGGIAARYGGEEFIIAIAGVGSAEAYRIADGIRREVENLWGDKPYRVTISGGVASYPPLHPGMLVQKADEALYQAKRSGKNMIVIREV
jgi:diguanylate cyclase (GGDEF)-like protein